MIFTIPFVDTATYFWAVSPLDLNVKRIRGVYSGATAKLYMQLHKGVQNSPTDTDISIPANATVPVEEFEILTISNFNFDMSVDPLTDPVAPMVLVLSTTAGALTAATGESLIDVFVDVETDSDRLIWNGYLGATQQVPAGSTLYASNSLSAKQQIWADSTTTHELLEIVAYHNVTGVTVNGVVGCYLKIFALNPTTGVTQPLMEFFVPKNQTTPFSRFNFGSNVGNGFIPQTQDSSGVLHQGLFVSMESAGGVYVSGNQVAYKIQVKYT